MQLLDDRYSRLVGWLPCGNIIDCSFIIQVSGPCDAPEKRIVHVYTLLMSVPGQIVMHGGKEGEGLVSSFLGRRPSDRVHHHVHCSRSWPSFLMI